MNTIVAVPVQHCVALVGSFPSSGPPKGDRLLRNKQHTYYRTTHTTASTHQTDINQIYIAVLKLDLGPPSTIVSGTGAGGTWPTIHHSYGFLVNMGYTSFSV
jgi:hypothetical protein